MSNNLFLLWAKENMRKAESSMHNAEKALTRLNETTEYAIGIKQLIKAHKEVVILWASKIKEEAEREINKL